jgi:redox-regulated HSP33 family molecular chaperone
MADQFVSYPFADADVKAQVASASPIAVTIQNQETVLPIAQLAAAATLNLTIGAGLKAGANLTVRTSVDGTNRVLTLGTGMTGLAQTLLANKSYIMRFFFDGTTFVHVATNLLN